MADYQLTQTGDEVQDLLDNIPSLKTSGVGFTLTDTTNFDVSSQQLYRFGSMRMLNLTLSTKTAISTGSHTIGTIASGDRPLYSVNNYIGREDSGSQGMGTVTVSPNGNVVYGVNITGVSGVTIKTQIVWFV